MDFNKHCGGTFNVMILLLTFQSSLNACLVRKDIHLTKIGFVATISASSFVFTVKQHPHATEVIRMTNMRVYRHYAVVVIDCSKIM
jgi:hypothetical protein